MSNTKIVVIKLKQIIYGVIFAVLGIALIILLITLFTSGGNDSTDVSNMAKYIPGKYSSEVSLNDTSLNLEVVVDANHIKSIEIVNLDDSITTMYPVVQPSIKSLADQLCNDVPISSVVISDDQKYTQTLLLETIQKALNKALVSQPEK